MGAHAYGMASVPRTVQAGGHVHTLYGQQQQEQQQPTHLFRLYVRWVCASGADTRLRRFLSNATGCDRQLPQPDRQSPAQAPTPPCVSINTHALLFCDCSCIPPMYNESSLRPLFSQVCVPRLQTSVLPQLVYPLCAGMPPSKHASMPCYLAGRNIDSYLLLLLWTCSMAWSGT